jgi:hypothetical protein
MLNIFNNNKPFILFFLPLLALAVCFPQFMNPTNNLVDRPMPLYALVNAFASGPFLQHFFFYLVLIINALLLNSIVIKHQLLLKNTNLVASLFLLIAATATNALTLSPLLFANVFLILALDKTLTLYNQQKVFSLCFQVGFLVAIAAHLYRPAALFLFLFFIALLVIRTFVWRDWIIALLGFLVPFLYSWTYYFWNGELSVYYGLLFSLSEVFQRSEFQWNTLQVVSGGVFAFAGVLSVYREMSKATVRHKNLLTIVLFYFGLTLLSFLFFSTGLNALFLMALAPLSIMLSIYLQSFKKRWKAELSFFLLLSFTIFNIVRGLL